MTKPTISADCLVETAYSAVADEFIRNFEERGDTGAACTIYVDGAVVVDLWAGETGRGPWRPGTRNVLFSVSKGILTTCILMAVEEGMIELDAPVARYWPEYGAEGKQATTVRQVLAHRAGLPGPDRPLTMADLGAWDPVVRVLAGQRPSWEPGATFAYHPLTVGWLAGEILRRATGLRPSEWLRDRIAKPLDADLRIGADPDDPLLAPIGARLPLDPAALPVIPQAELDFLERCTGMHGAFDGTDLLGSANREDFLRTEIPAANITGSAHDLARFYAATIGEVDGIRLLTEKTIDDAVLPVSVGKPWLGPEGPRWGTGFGIRSSVRRMAGPRSFGHDGAGGQLGFADPDHQVAFGYQTVRPGGFDDHRAEALSQALRGLLR